MHASIYHQRGDSTKLAYHVIVYTGTGSDGGYVCALWQLFHFLTAECVRKNCSALPIIINYVQYFYRYNKRVSILYCFIIFLHF